MRAVPLNHPAEISLSDEGSTAWLEVAGQSSYVILPPGEGWRQILALPVTTLRDDGILFDNHGSGRMLWIELESGSVWGVFFRSKRPFLSFRDIERICQRLDEARFEVTEKVFSHLAAMFGWLKAGSANAFELISTEIAEDIVKETIHAVKAWNYQYLLTAESVNQLSQPYLRQFKQGLISFANALDQELLRLTQVDLTKGQFVFSHYNYLQHPLEKVCRNRKQALQAYPLLVNIFCAENPDYAARRLQHCVDLGNPLPTAVAEYFQCSKTVARFLAEKSLDLIGEHWCSQPEKLADMLELIKPDYWPKTGEDWEFFNTWIVPVFEALVGQRDSEPSPLLQNGLNDLVQEGYQRIPARFVKHGIIMHDINNLHDFERVYLQWCVKVDIENSDAVDAMTQVSLLRFAALSRRWHQWQAQVLDESKESGAADDQEHWPTFIESPWVYEDLCVVPLTTAWQLDDEGERMKHCVGSYASQCIFDGSHIFSIRDREGGSSLSTFEIKLAYEVTVSNPYKIIQHQGVCDSDPPEKCKAALVAFLRYLNVAVSVERLQEIRFQQCLRQENSDEYQKLMSSSAWSIRKIEGFRQLLKDCPVLLEPEGKCHLRGA